MTECNNQRKNVIWNMIFSILNAAQSAILLYFVNRICKEEHAGVFSFAFSLAVLFMYIGNYGIRNFQVSDTKQRYSASQYYAFRTICLLAMIISVGFYLILRYVFSNGSNVSNALDEKFYVIIALCLMRLAECLEDVFHGRYQQQNALYLAGIQGTARILIANVLFVAVLFIRKNLTEACMVMTIASWVCVLVFTACTINKFGGFSLDYTKNAMKNMLSECFPLFAGYFLITYLGNVTKYALERYETDTLQAYFNMIFMPVLVINLLSTMVFRPIIVTMAKNFNEGNLKAYRSMVKRQEWMIAGIAIVVIPIGYFLGIPVLSWFYDSNLANYKAAFLILLVAGTLSAYSSFLNVCIITIRGQLGMLLSTLFTAVIAYFITYRSLGYFVMHPETTLMKSSIFSSADSLHMGVAAFAYLISMLLQAALYFILHERILKKREKGGEQK